MSGAAAATAATRKKKQAMEYTIILGRRGAVESDGITPTAHKVMLDLIPQIPISLMQGGAKENIRVLDLNSIPADARDKTLSQLRKKGIEESSSPILFQRSTKNYSVNTAACYELCFAVDALGSAPPKLDIALFGEGNPVARTYHHGSRYAKLQRKHAHRVVPARAMAEAAEIAVRSHPIGRATTNTRRGAPVPFGVSHGSGGGKPPGGGGPSRALSMRPSSSTGPASGAGASVGSMREARRHAKGAMDAASGGAAGAFGAGARMPRVQWNHPFVDASTADRDDVRRPTRRGLRESSVDIVQLANSKEQGYVRR